MVILGASSGTMKDNVPVWGAAATPGPEPPSASSGLDTTLDELRQILQLTAELRAGSRSTSPTEGRGQARTSALRPTDPPSDLPCPPGMPRATYRRLLKRHDRSSRKLTALASRRLLPHVRKRLDSQFRNALRRVRRALGLPEWEPGRRTWYSLSAAAGYLGISPRTLLRWDVAGIITSRRTAGGHRRFHHRDLVRLRAAGWP